MCIGTVLNNFKNKCFKILFTNKLFHAKFSSLKMNRYTKLCTESFFVFNDTFISISSKQNQFHTPRSVITSAKRLSNPVPVTFIYVQLEYSMNDSNRVQ